MLSKVQDADEAIELGREAGRRLGVDPSDLWLQAQRLAEAVRPAAPVAASAAPPDVTWFERDLCQLVLQAPEARAVLLPLIDAATIAHPGARAILTALRDAPALAPEALLQRLPDDGARAPRPLAGRGARVAGHRRRGGRARGAPRTPASSAAGSRDLADRRAVGSDRRHHRLHSSMPRSDRNRPNPGRRRGSPETRDRPNLTTEDARP